MEKELLTELYIRHYRELYFYLYTLCGIKELAEDICQETFFKALIFLDGEHANCRAWLFRVGRNLFLNELRRNRKEINGADAIIYGTGEKSDKNVHADPEHTVMKMEEMKILEDAVRVLDLRKRDILLLTYGEQFSLKEAAQIMGISYDNARVLSYRAKKEIRKYMEGKGHEVL